MRQVAAMFPWADRFRTVAVTGTNGKTTTTLMCAAALRAGGESVISETTIGYEIDGEPLSVSRSMRGFIEAFTTAQRRGCERACIETTSFALSRGFAQRWRCDVGVFTNLSHDHLRAHGSWEHYLASKAQLFMHLPPTGAAILNAGDRSAQALAALLPHHITPIWYAAPSRPALRPADLVAEQVTVSLDGSSATLAPSPLADALGSQLQVSFIGSVHIENALAAAAAAHVCGTAGDAILRGLASCPPVPGRFQVIARDPAVVIDYAHSPDALARTLDDARRLLTTGRLLVVFGAGGGADSDKRVPMGAAVGSRADVAFITSDNPRHEDPREIARALRAGCRQGGRARCHTELDRRSAIELALNEAGPADLVLIAGKGHEHGQTIGNETLPFDDAAVARALITSPMPLCAAPAA